MNKDHLLAPLVIISLSALFAIVSLAVILSNGKSKYWVAKKMRIGAILLTFGSFANQGCNPVITCYDPVMPNQFSIDSADYGDTIRIDLSQNNIITGMLHAREGEDFSFNITDSIISENYSGETIQKGEILAKDGTFDSAMEEIKIELDQSTPAGLYFLNLYCSLESSQIYPYSIYKIEITNED